MQYRDFGNSGKKLPLLGFGCMRLPVLEDDKTIDEAAAQKMVDYALANGVNYFDTAYTYHHGESEAFLGRALSRYPRDSYYLASKLPIWYIKSEEDVHKYFDGQLKKCQTDYFDFYLMHNYSAESAQTGEQIGIYDILKQKQREGKIRHLGFSTHDSLEGLAHVASLHEWEFAQLQLNYMDWDLLHSREQYELLTKKNIPVIVMEPVRGGALATLNEGARE
ncbi:aldo/keto reductase, partial [Christensenellaceae bacterium OttesenSCG-928-K19]|nr:aldo/keto reductase [Christensenellaceae bacterium OttesenSCG-928-K19]